MIGLLISMGLAQAAPQAPAAPPAPTAAVDPARLAAAGRLLEAMHIDRQYDSMFSQLIPVMSVQLFGILKDNTTVPAALRSELAKPDRQAEAQRYFAEESLRGFKANYPAMKAATAREYAAIFTTDEIAQLSAFYASPVGQKALATMPQLQAKLMPIGMAAGQAVGQDAMRKTVEHMQIEPGKPKA